MAIPNEKIHLDNPSLVDIQQANTEKVEIRSNTGQPFYGSISNDKYRDIVVINKTSDTLETCDRRHKISWKWCFVVPTLLLMIAIQATKTQVGSCMNKADAVFEILGQKHQQKIEEWQQPLYFKDQLVDHFNKRGAKAQAKKTWSNRYYVNSKHFKGPGSPLIVVMGGEGSVDEILYPFVRNKLAKTFVAYVLQTEHRFYGVSFPTKGGPDKLPTNDEFKTLLSPDQALADYARLIRHIQKNIGCSVDRTSPNYCPVITVGASYPGFLSAMMRFVYPDLVDMAYASSAPIRLYARQANDIHVYFDHITQVADSASPGCANSVKSTLVYAYEEIANNSLQGAIKSLGICIDEIPKYISNSKILADEVGMLVGINSAELNMDYYPPGDPSTSLLQMCKIFQQEDKTAIQRMYDYFQFKKNYTATDEGHDFGDCYNLHWDIPDGPNATITGADWTGVGDGLEGTSWEYQTCVDVVVTAGYGPQSMFLEREFQMPWLREHCQSRFHVDPAPHRMVEKWHFDDLVGQGASHILFTNGLHDGWSVYSHTESLSDTLLALNFPSGAHHSELNTISENQKEEDDIVLGRLEIARILGEWIDGVKQQAQQ